MKKYKNIFLIIVIFAIAFVGYTVMFDKGEDEALLSSQSTQGASAVESDLVTLLIELRSVELDDSIFSNPAFRRLKDFSQELIPEPIGRNNPFAPLGTDVQIPNSKSQIPNNIQ